MARGIGKFAHKADLRHEAPVLRAIHGLAEEDQQRGHEQKHRQKAAQDGLDQAHAHVHAEAEFHEGHGRQARDGGQAAGKDLRNGGGQRLLRRLADPKRLMLLLIAVAEDDGVVHRERELQDDGHGIGDEGDRAEEEVRPEVDDGRDQEGQDHHGDLRVGAGGKEQDREHHEHHEDQHRGHLLGEKRGQTVTDAGIDGGIVARQQRLHGLQGLAAGLRFRHVGEGQLKERVPVLVVRLRVIVGNQDHVPDPGQGLRERFRLFLRDPVHHDLGRAVGDEFSLHDVQALVRLRLLGKVDRDVVLHLDPADGEDGKHDRREKQRAEKPSVFDNAAGDIFDSS